jgi:uncharacterized damage-inducible protein DinB
MSNMSAQVILQCLFNCKTSVNEEILAELAKIDFDAHQSEQQATIRLSNPICVVDRIFAAHLSGERHSRLVVGYLKS